ncbi:MAG: TonB-dependent receptor, partial [Deltaproteobacteria bacterium]|nr:TonB-dependent receptor [Deltaproteobacteria bacterium]
MTRVIRASRFRTIVAATTSLVLALAGVSWADQHEGADPEGATPARSSEVENITITAERRETLLEETPVSVTAFTPSAIEELDINNVVNLSEFTPNLNIHTNAGGNTGATIGIRGAITSDPVLSLEPTVGIYLNGVYVGHSVGALFDMPDMAGIQVLRGPQGTLYGRNTVGGAITIDNIRPSGEWGMRQQFRVGNYYNFRSQTSVDFPFFGGEGFATPSWLGTLSGRATFQYETRDGFYANTAGDYTDPISGDPIIPGSSRLDDLNRMSGLVAVNWELPWDI